MSWVVLTVAAAFVQNVRSYLQKRLTGRLSVLGAAYVRFVFALPFAWLYCLGVMSLRHADAPLEVNFEFLGYCLVGGIGQVAATVWLLDAFTERNFMAATALSKTETVQAAAFGLLLLGDTLTWASAAGILVSLAGVLLLSGWQRGLRFDRAAWLGLLAGAGFAVAAVSYRGATLALDAGDVITRASLTVAVVLTMQTVLMGGYVLIRDRAQVLRLWQVRWVGVAVGLAGALASAGWFTAMAMVSAALVRAVGQIELLFALATSVWLLRERVAPREIAGAVLILGGILLLIS